MNFEKQISLLRFGFADNAPRVTPMFIPNVVFDIVYSFNIWGELRSTTRDDGL